MKQDELLIKTVRELEFDSQKVGAISFKSFGLVSAKVRFENNFMEYWDPNWKKEMDFIKLAPHEKSQQKPIGKNNNKDGVNRDKVKVPYTEMVAYWNFYHTDELEIIDWKFHTPLDNLSFLGGLLDILFLIPSFIMLIYTFRLNEINVFFFQQYL